MRMFGYPFYLVYVYVLTACAPTASVSTSADKSRYSEDLSLLRPKTEVKSDTVVVKSPEKTKNTTYVEPKYAVNEKLDAVLDSIDNINLAKKFVEGFTIQVYSGRREDALNTRKQLTSLLPDLSSEVQFTEPIFRVKAGKYYNWIDAQGDFTLIKKYFPAAIIIPDKIAIN
jgi:hypothetical protein